MGKKNILFIYTGGTIGSEIDPRRADLPNPMYVIQPSPDSLITRARSTPHVSYLLNQVDLEVITPMLLMSEDIIPADWEELARIITRRINRGVTTNDRLDGVIIAHGTDTMSYTATALSFLLQGISVPVVLTGASHPPADHRSDAFSNLRGALITIVEPGMDPDAGVFVAFKEESGRTCHIHLGARVQQIKPFETCFTSIHESIYAEVTDTGLKLRDRPVNMQKAKADYGEMGAARTLDRNVVFIRVYPGMQPCYLKFCADHGARAIILETYHSATFCTRRDTLYDLLPVLRTLHQSGVCLLFSHLANGSTEIGGPEYTSPLVMLRELDAIPLRSMTMEAMLIKTMWALGMEPNNKDAFRKLMTTEHAYEVCNDKCH